jgi:hypothetical protein
MQPNTELTDFGPSHLPSGRLPICLILEYYPPINSSLPHLNLGRLAIRAARGPATGAWIGLDVDTRSSTPALFERSVRPWKSFRHILTHCQT